jgi:hypothetical protein
MALEMSWIIVASRIWIWDMDMDAGYGMLDGDDEM